MKLQSEIRNVTVYPQGCTITRSVTFSLEKGETKVKIGPIAPPIDKDSVHVSAKSTQSGLKILGVDVLEEKIKPEIPAKDLKELIEKKEQLETEQTAIEDRINYLSDHKQVYTTLEDNLGKHFSREYARGKTTGARLTELMLLLEKNEKELYPKIRQLEKDLESIEDEIELINDKIQKLEHESMQPTLKIFVEVDLQTDKKSELELHLDYNTRSAKWHPVYDLRIQKEKSNDSMALEYYGVVQQNSKENWTDIILSLSTARPTKITTVPDFNPQWIRKPRPRPAPTPTAGGGPPRAAPMMFKAEIAAEPRAREKAKKTMDKKAERVTATFDQDSVSEALIFNIPKKQTLSATGEPKKVLVTQLELPFDQFFKSIPKLNPEVYNLAEITNNKDLVLLPGKVRIFTGNDFIGSTNIEKIATNETFEVCLGTIDTIKVERKLTDKTTEIKGTLSKTSYETYQYNIKVQNLRNDSSQITVEDQFPKSDVADVKVKLLEQHLEPSDNVEITKLNIIKWKLEMKPKEEITLKFAYKVSYPPDERPIGL